MRFWPKIFSSLLLSLILTWSFWAYSDALPAHPSRARGAILFMNYCSGCHSLHYVSWPRMVKDLNLAQQNSIQINSSLYLSLPNLSNTWPQIAMASWDAKQWFGKPPPDLSLISRQRGTLWITTYLLGFYPDSSQRFGVNNHRFPNSMMPHVLESLQNELSTPDFAAVVADIVYFLEYAAEPSILERTTLGWFVLGFLLIFCGLYWLRMRRPW
ncbi:MAG: cytochrome c1 [Gammaproteobacteria bacterium]